LASLEKAADERWTLAAIEAAYARLVVDRSRGNFSEAARILGVDRRTLQKKLEPGAS
jgi:DNA-binding protein Fis